MTNIYFNLPSFKLDSGYNVEALVESIKESIIKEEEAEHGTGWDVILLPSPAFKRMLIVGLGSAISQQLVGIDAVQYFLSYIISEAGVEDRLAQTWILIGLGLLKLTFVVIAGNVFDRKGRRKMMFVSLLGEDSSHIFSFPFPRIYLILFNIDLS